MTKDKKFEKLDVYLANLEVGNIYLHNLHWNVEGFTFKAVHEYLEGLYDEFFEMLDAVAEYERQKGVFPPASLKEYLELSDLKERESKTVEAKEAIEKALELIKHMKELALEIREETECFVLSNMLEDHVTNYNKEILFMESMLK